MAVPRPWSAGWHPPQGRIGLALASFLDMRRKYAAGGRGMSPGDPVLTTTNTFRRKSAVRTVQAGPLTGMIAQMLLVASLAGSVGLSAAGWIVGLTCAALMNAALARGLS